MQSWGNLWAIFVLVTIGSATFSSLGLIVASVTNTMQETQMINNLIWMAFPFSFRRHDSAGRFPHGCSEWRCSFPPISGHRAGIRRHQMRPRPLEVLEDFVALALGFWVAFEVSRQLFRWEPEAKVPRRAKLWVLAALVPFLLFGSLGERTGQQTPTRERELPGAENGCIWRSTIPCGEIDPRRGDNSRNPLRTRPASNSEAAGEAMKAIRIKEFGGPEVMKLEEVPDLKPGAGQVVVRLRAIGVNPVDTYMRAGTYPRKPSLP